LPVLQQQQQCDDASMEQVIKVRHHNTQDTHPAAFVCNSLHSPARELQLDV
jgi:hypothetical protein